MNDNNARFWKWTVILLLICNAGLILTIFFRPGTTYGRRGETPRDFVIRNLKFSDEQVKQYDVLIKDHQAAMRRLRDEAQRYREDLFSTYKNEQVSNSAVDSLGQLIANTQKQIELVTYRHFELVRKLCTETQKKDFDNIISDVMKKMNGPHHGPPPPDGNGPPPPPPGGEGPPPPDGR
jgi:periplasmic protein CpxP/Spy